MQEDLVIKISALLLVALSAHVSPASVPNTPEPVSASVPNPEPVPASVPNTTASVSASVPNIPEPVPASVPNTTASVSASTDPGNIEQYHNQKKSCSHHSQCSCISGIPICHNGFCNCIMTTHICLKHSDCALRCQYDIGVCLGNACRCYKLVEDRKMSESLSPMSYEEDPK